MSSRVLLAILVTTLLGGPTFAEPVQARRLYCGVSEVGIRLVGSVCPEWRW